jgi:hypothetical protein
VVHDDSRRLFQGLWAAFAVQVAGRLLDLQWHRTHSEFETGSDQVRAHWLVWLGTLLVIIVAAMALRSGTAGRERPAYLITLIANLLYVGVAVIHFNQHLNHQEVDWAHISLALTNVGSVVGVLMVTGASIRHRGDEPRAAA